jgi:hypothetical protein
MQCGAIVPVSRCGLDAWELVRRSARGKLLGAPFASVSGLGDESLSVKLADTEVGHDLTGGRGPPLGVCACQQFPHPGQARFGVVTDCPVRCSAAGRGDPVDGAVPGSLTGDQTVSRKCPQSRIDAAGTSMRARSAPRAGHESQVGAEC